MHHHRIAHRDLKPENLLLDSNFNLKICDLGLSNILKDGRSLDTSCGSPNYAAPEIITGSIYDGREIDVWSSGVILFTMLAGYLPFDENSVSKLFPAIEHSNYTFPSFFSDDVKDLINRIL